MTGTPLLPAGQVKTLPAEGGLVLAVRPGPTPRSATFSPTPSLSRCVGSANRRRVSRSISRCQRLPVS